MPLGHDVVPAKAFIAHADEERLANGGGIRLHERRTLGTGARQALLLGDLLGSAGGSLGLTGRAVRLGDAATLLLPGGFPGGLGRGALDLFLRGPVGGAGSGGLLGGGLAPRGLLDGAVGHEGLDPGDGLRDILGALLFADDDADVRLGRDALQRLHQCLGGVVPSRVSQALALPGFATMRRPSRRRSTISAGHWAPYTRTCVAVILVGVLLVGIGLFHLRSGSPRKASACAGHLSMQQFAVYTRASEIYPAATTDNPSTSMGHPDDPSRFPLCESAGTASIVSEAISRRRDRDTDQMPTENEIREFARLYAGMTPKQVAADET